MNYKGFTKERDGIYIHFDNVALRFDDVEEIRKIARMLNASAEEIDNVPDIDHNWENVINNIDIDL